MEKQNFEYYQKYLSKIMECQEKQDSTIEHEWLLNSRNEAVKVANYLRGFGYKVENKISKPFSRLTLYYVGVPFKTLKK